MRNNTLRLHLIDSNVSSLTKLFNECAKEIVEAVQHPHRKLWVFDFDDTLVKTDCAVHVTNPDGSRFDLTPSEYAVYHKQSGQVFDYTDFRLLIRPRVINWTNQILCNVYQHHGAGRIVILSARTSAAPIHQFLVEIGLDGIEVAALNDSNPYAKAAWIAARIKRDNLDIIEFFDDSHRNVVAVAELQHMHPEVQIVARHIVCTQTIEPEA